MVLSYVWYLLGLKGYMESEIDRVKSIVFKFQLCNIILFSFSKSYSMLFIIWPTMRTGPGFHIFTKYIYFKENNRINCVSY